MAGVERIEAWQKMKWADLESTVLKAKEFGP